MSAESPERAVPGEATDTTAEPARFEPASVGLSETALVLGALKGVDLESLSLTEVIQIQNHLSRTLRRRFERERAIAFTDVVGSTAYFRQYGDEAGRRLIQRHLDQVAWAVGRRSGRIVDTAGDGALTCFPSAEAAATALIELQKRIAAGNESHPRQHRLRLRVGIHWGAVLTDDTHVTGDAVNLCARVASAAEPGEIRVSGDAFRALPAPLRVRCRALPPATYKGIDGQSEQWSLVWHDLGTAPRRLRIEETGLERPIPDLPLVRFGRLAELDGKAANDVVLELPDPAHKQKISRWHFELERLDDGRFLLRQESAQLTEVNGVAVPQGGTAAIAAGTVVRIGGVLTITFLADPPAETLDETTRL